MKQDGTIIDMHEKNLWVSSFQISAPAPNHQMEEIDGRHGELKLGTTLQSRKIKAQLTVEATDYISFDLFRDELFTIFNPLEDFYIIRDLQPAKRLKVSVSNHSDLEYVFLELGEMEIEFVIHSTFIESIGTTLNPLTFDEEKWQTGQGLLLEEPIYVHQNVLSFQIFNAGDIVVDPCEFPLKIEFKGESTNLQIKNTTTGDMWQYNGSTTENDTLSIDGIKSLKNGISVFKDTNKKLIKIDKGWNEFMITGASEFLITFDFRFYYL